MKTLCGGCDYITLELLRLRALVPVGSRGEGGGIGGEGEEGEGEVGRERGGGRGMRD